MILKILILAVLSVGAVVSIYDPQYVEKTKPYHRDPHIAAALEHHHHHQHRRGSYVPRTSSYRPRLSAAHQQPHVEQHERHANYGRDYANNIDEYYGGCPSGFTGQLPYPYDCRRFVNCWKGRAYIQTCGPGTVFNGQTLECDSPSKVVCEGLKAQSRPNSEPTNHRLGRIQTAPSNDEEVSCPQGFSGLLPHPQDCSKFLNCDRGTRFIQNCGPQTLFNSRIKACDFAHNVDCGGLSRGDNNAPSPAPITVSGNRGGKTFEIVARESQRVNQIAPHRKGWGHHNHHHQHHGFSSHPPSRQYGSIAHHNHNCTEHHHHLSPPPVGAETTTPIFYRDRWTNMNRTRPATGSNTGTNTTRNSTNWSWTRTTNWSRWTTTTPQPSRSQPNWPHGSSGGSRTTTTTTARPPSNYPNIYYGNSPNRTDTQTTTTTNTTTSIFYAQPVDDDQPSEEVFTNVYGGDVNEITLPSRRRNASRGISISTVIHSNQSTDAINIPNLNLMPPHPSSQSDDRQFQIPDQYPEFSSPQPSNTAPQAERPPQPSSWTQTTVFVSPRSDNLPDQDAMTIPSLNLMPPYRTPPSQTPENYPYSSYGAPDTSPNSRNPAQYPHPSYGPPQPQRPSYNRTTVYVSSWPIDDQTSVDALNIPSGTPPQQGNPSWPSFTSPDSNSPPRRDPNWPSFSSPGNNSPSEGDPNSSRNPPPQRDPNPSGNPPPRRDPNWPSFSSPASNSPPQGDPNSPPPRRDPNWPSFSSPDEGQSQVPEPYPDFSVPRPSFSIPESQPQLPRPASRNQPTGLPNPSQPVPEQQQPWDSSPSRSIPEQYPPWDPNSSSPVSDQNPPWDLNPPSPVSEQHPPWDPKSSPPVQGQHRPWNPRQSPPLSEQHPPWNPNPSPPVPEQHPPWNPNQSPPVSEQHQPWDPNPSPSVPGQQPPWDRDPSPPVQWLPNSPPPASNQKPSRDRNPSPEQQPPWPPNPSPDQHSPWDHHSSPPISEQQPSPIPIDESNLFGGMLPPLPSAPEPPNHTPPIPSSTPIPSWYTPPTPSSTPTPSWYTPLPAPSKPTPSSWNRYIPPTPPSTPNHNFTSPSALTPQSPALPGVKTNVRVFQIYPPPSVQNATTVLHPNPFYSPSYSGVAHSRNVTWSSRPPIKTLASAPSRATPSPRTSTTTFVPEDNFEPEIIFSHEGGVVIPSQVNHLMSPTSTQRHGVSPPKQRNPSDISHPPDEANSSDEVGQLPISEAIRLLLRPYFNRSGTVTDDMAAKAESHIMNLSRSREPTTTPSSTSTSTSTSTTTTTTVAPQIDHDVEIVFAGEQNSLTPGFVHPIQSPVHPSSNFHQHQHHDRNFHRTHPYIPNPFETEDDTQHELTTPRTHNTTEQVVVEDPSVADVCEFDCGNGQCVKTFETCDGVNHCGNRKDEEQCDHLGYEIRLSNGSGGRVEVKILGQWGYVCDDKFGIQDANVVCRELGFPLGASEVRGNSYYPPVEGGEVTFVMDELDCSGNETSLKECEFKGWGISDCGPDEVVGIECKTPVMKCPNDYWLCSTSMECIPPAFVCDNVPDCSDQSDESSSVCNSTVEYRLKGGRSKMEGRLEVLYRGVWGTICDDDFGQTEAQVACNSLGFYGTAKLVKNAFGPGSGPIWLDQVSCFGNESTIDACSHWSWGEHNCNHTEDVSVKCISGSRPRPINTGVKGSPQSTEDVQTPTPDDIGMDLYPMERSSKFANNRKVCGHFNPNLTEELPVEFERVVKGNVAKRGHHPWQATIRTKGRGGISSHWCGAVLISKKHLLTAAHCLVGYPKGAYFIRLGDHYANIAESSEIDSYIENWYIHEKFREGTHMNNDIAVIVMKNPVRFNDYIQPICLPREGTEYQEGRRCTISGWGSIQSGVSTPSNNLRVAEIPVISDEMCKLPHVYGNSITEGMFCAGFLEESVDACEGDSGGPFVCSDSGAETLYGIISWGQQCGHANKPGVYVKIEKYLDWIYEKIRFSMQQTN